MKRLLLFCLMLLLSGSFGLVTVAAEAGDEREVVATGVGHTEDEAKRQAYRNAIQSVVGSMVVAETLVENDQLLRDKVLSHSDGYITQTSQVGSTKDLGGGLLEVTMRVTVKSQQLKAKLQDEKITLASVDGESLFTQLATKSEATKDATAIVTESLRGLPGNVLKASADITKAELTDGGGSATISLPVTVEIDYEAYELFSKNLIKTLSDLGYKRQPVTAVMDTNNHGDKSYRYNFMGKTKNDNFIDPATMKKIRHDSGDFLLAVAEVVSPEAKTSRWSQFVLPKALHPAFAEAWANAPILTVTFADATGNEIAIGELDLALLPNGQRIDDRLGNVIAIRGGTVVSISPMLYSFVAHREKLELVNNDKNERPVADKRVMTMDFSVTNEELRKITAVRCLVANE